MKKINIFSCYFTKKFKLLSYILTGKTMNEDKLMKKMTDMINFISPDD